MFRAVNPQGPPASSIIDVDAMAVIAEGKAS